MKIKAILMDIDGTLTNERKEITPRTRRVLLAAQEQGAKLVLASGRPTQGLRAIARELQMDKHHGLLVSYNGSAVTDAQTNETLFSKTIPADESRAVLEHILKFDVRPVVYKGDYLYTNDLSRRMITVDGAPFDVIAYEGKCCCMEIREQRDLLAFADYPMNKVLTAGNPEYLAAHREEMAAPFEGTLNHMFTSPFYLEFTAKNIDKAEALDAVLSPLGIFPAEMVAFGDGQNDISMLKYAGLGVAMANADEKVKAAADEITLSNEEDGLAAVLERFFPAE